MKLNVSKGVAGDMRTRVEWHGGVSQQDRMIKDKYRSFQDALKHSYQGAQIRRLGDLQTARALIVPNRLAQDYDEKLISIGFEHHCHPGDIIEWLNTDTKWIIYLQELTELAYFRGNIRKCSYEIIWQNASGELCSTFAAIRGPREQGIETLQKAGMSLDVPNYTLRLLLPKQDDTLEYFNRYSKFYLKDLQGGEANTCWRVEARDTVSLPGIMEVYATEYYANVHTDDIDNGIVNGLVNNTIDIVISNIDGEDYIKPRKSYTYTYLGMDEDEWIIDKSAPIEAKIEGKTIVIKWTQNYSYFF